jgi:hypothetical protein
MTIDQSFHDISERATRLQTMLRDILLWAVIEGAPEDGDHVLLTRYEEAANDLLGIAHELRVNADLACGRSRRDCRNGLIECQKRTGEITRRFYWDLYSPEAAEGLQVLEGEENGKWRSWTNGLKDALAQCRVPIDDLNQALLQAWMELSEYPRLAHSSSGSVCCDSAPHPTP